MAVSREAMLEERPEGSGGFPREVTDQDRQRAAAGRGLVDRRGVFQDQEVARGLGRDLGQVQGLGLAAAVGADRWSVEDHVGVALDHAGAGVDHRLVVDPGGAAVDRRPVEGPEGAAVAHEGVGVDLRPVADLVEVGLRILVAVVVDLRPVAVPGGVDQGVIKRRVDFVIHDDCVEA